MKLIVKMALAGLAGALAATAATQIAAAPEPAAKMTVEKNTDRPGSDYNAFWMDKPQANMCRQACKTDSRCVAYTYVKPGVQGEKARCWLKNAVPEPVESDCCESGVKE